MKEESINYYLNKEYFFGKNVIITGATGGIGSILLETLVRLGAKIVALVAVMIAAGAVIALWNAAAGAVVMVIGVVATLWCGTKMIKKAEE